MQFEKSSAFVLPKEPTTAEIDKQIPLFERAALQIQKEGLSVNEPDPNRSSIAAQSHYSIEQLLE